MTTCCESKDDVSLRYTELILRKYFFSMLSVSICKNQAVGETWYEKKTPF